MILPLGSFCSFALAMHSSPGRRGRRARSYRRPDRDVGEAPCVAHVPIELTHSLSAVMPAPVRLVPDIHALPAAWRRGRRGSVERELGLVSATRPDAKPGAAMEILPAIAKA